MSLSKILEIASDKPRRLVAENLGVLIVKCLHRLLFSLAKLLARIQTVHISISEPTLNTVVSHFLKFKNSHKTSN